MNMRKQWRCFHCDELFISRKRAADHFGAEPADPPACKLRSHEVHILVALRKAQEELASYRTDDSDLMRSIYSLEDDSRRAVIKAEQAGYDKGVKDMRDLHGIETQIAG
jgi:hypothetical protein